MVLEKIPLALSTLVTTEKKSITTEEESVTAGEESPPTPEKEEKEMEDIKDDVLHLWLIVWVSQPDFVIARSVLSSAVGVVATICTVFYGAEWITEDFSYTHFHDRIDWLRYTSTALECLLIVVGGSIILRRWGMAVIYFPKDRTYFLHAEDFWRRYVFDKIDNINYRRRGSWEKQVSTASGGFVSHVKLDILRVCGFHIWLLPLVLRMQLLTVCFSKLCGFLSQVILTPFVLCKPRPHKEMKERYKISLQKLAMPGETPEMLWAATEKAFNKTEKFMAKGCEDAIPKGPTAIPGTKLKLVDLMAKGSSAKRSAGEQFLVCLEKTEGLEVEKDFSNLKKLSCRMTVLSLIRVMMKLGATRDCLSNVLQAYDEAYEFLDLLDYRPFSSSINAADKEFALIKREVGERAFAETEVGDLEQIIKDTVGRQTKYTKQDSVDWWAAASDNSLYKICAAIYNDNQNDKEIMDTIDLDSVHSLLGAVMVIKLKEAATTIVKQCAEWAKGMDEEKIRAAVYIIGKVDGVMKAYRDATPENV